MVIFGVFWRIQIGFFSSEPSHGLVQDGDVGGKESVEGDEEGVSAVEVGPGLDVDVVQGEEEQLHLLEDVPVVGRGGAQEFHLSKEGGSQPGEGGYFCFLQKCHFSISGAIPVRLSSHKTKEGKDDRYPVTAEELYFFSINVVVYGTRKNVRT